MRIKGSVDLCLVVPPFDAIRFPPLGASILAAACRSRGLEVSVIYGSIALASRLGYDTYREVCTKGFQPMLGERLFAPHAYPGEVLATLGEAPSLPDPLQALLDRCAGEIGPFLDDLAAQVLALQPRIVGITTNFQQNLAAAGLARRIKAAAPETCIVLGGANVAGRMAHGLAQVFTCVDHFFSGEADVDFADFCERFLAEGLRPPHKVVACAPIKDMAVVHAPDFSDYFAQLRAGQRSGRLPAHLPDFLTMETSRGCWWGEKHHCTFCGLNGDGMQYRRKSADRAFAEIKDLTTTWNVRRFFFADNIMPLGFLDDLLPALEQWEERPRLFYEVKANLREDQLVAMARGGIDRIQPGIESLSTNVLRLMRKGVTGLQNVALMRACRSIGITVAWNYLYGFPGERLEDYEEALQLLPALEHFEPPSGFVAVIIDRFSPYFNTPSQLGVGEIAPRDSYRGLYPRTAPLRDIAFHFDGSYSTPLLANAACVESMRAAIARWRERWGSGNRPSLMAVDKGGAQILIVDTRRIARRQLTSIPRAMDDTLRRFERPRSASGLDAATAEHVQYLLDHRFMVQHERQLLSVVTRLERMAKSMPVRPQPAAQPEAA